MRVADSNNRINMSENYKFVQNRKCEFWPCHKGIIDKEFNCLFCFCPLYSKDNCGGNYKIMSNNIKDCSSCLVPHQKNNYDYIISKLKEQK